MATNQELIKYFGRSSQTVHRNIETDVTISLPEISNTCLSTQYLARSNGRFYIPNVPSNIPKSFTDSMISSHTVHRNGTCTSNVLVPSSIGDLPSPKHLMKRKEMLPRNIRSNDKWIDCVTRHLKELKSNCTTFDLLLDLKSLNRSSDAYPRPVVQEATTPSEELLSPTSSEHVNFNLEMLNCTPEILVEPEDPLLLSPKDHIPSANEVIDNITNTKLSPVEPENDSELPVKPKLFFEFQSTRAFEPFRNIDFMFNFSEE